MLLRRYRLPVQQYVLFLGAGPASMTTVLAEDNMQFRFSLIAFSSIDYNLFVGSQKPEEIILGILANFKQVADSIVIKEILTGLNKFAVGELDYRRYTKQLRVLAQLRNLATQIDFAMDSIVPFLDEKKDIFYIAGKVEVLKKVIVNLLATKTFSDEQIADLTGVDVEDVRNLKIKEGLN